MEGESIEQASPWYEAIETSKKLEQGDFVNDCPFVTPLLEMASGSAEVYDFDVIDRDIVIVSHSCDLEHEKLPFVLVCPVLSLDEFVKNASFFRNDVGKELLRQGISPAYYMLNECSVDGFQRQHSVVLFKDLFTIPYSFIKKLDRQDEKRLRLLSPYREDLSQAFGKFFMRVGLPKGIDPFTNLSKFVHKP